MSRINFGKAWLMLLLLPAVVTAQNETVDRGRARSDEGRTERVERTVDRTRSVEKRAKSGEKPRLREEKVSPNRGKTTNAGPRTGSRSDRRGGRATAPSVRVTDRRSEARTTRNNGSRDPKRESSRKAPAQHRHERRGAPPKIAWHGAHKARRPVFHAPVRFGRHPATRFFYRDLRYHRPHRSGLSIGFFIRIPSARWHVGRARVFTYRQVVTGHPVGPVEVVSTFTRKIKDVRRDYVEVEFELDRLAVTSAGRFMGEVDRFPGDLRRVRAKIYRDGFVQFDRMLYVVGNHLTGFELLSTRYCGGDLTGADYECLDPRSGELDFYRGRVNDTAFSNLLDLAQVGRVVPVALVPDDENLGFQYVVGYGRSSDGYYSGSFDYSSLNRFESDGTAYRLPEGPEIDGFQLSDGDTQVYESSFANETVISYASGDGQMIDLRHRAEVRYIGD